MYGFLRVNLLVRESEARDSPTAAGLTQATVQYREYICRRIL